MMPMVKHAMFAGVVETKNSRSLLRQGPTVMFGFVHCPTVDFNGNSADRGEAPKV